MAAPTAIEVSVDNTQYSRYESGRETITVSVTITGGAPYSSEDILVELVKARRSRDAVAASSTISITGNVDPQESEVTFYLPDVVDQDLINLVRNGKYFVQATSVTDPLITGSSDDFDINIVTIDRLKNDYLYGIDLKATEMKAPKFQPSQIPVEITEVSKTHPLGFATLTYNYTRDDLTNATASIGSGANGTVNIEADEDNAGEPGNDFSVVVVVPSGTSGLSVSLSGDDLTVNLAVIAGVPDDPANTATLIAAAITAITGFTATASGTGADSISAAEGPTAFLGGTSTFIRTLSWRGGKSVSLTSTGIVILPMGTTGPIAKLDPSSSNDYICVRIRSLLSLPEQTVAEEILIDKKTIDDDTLQRFLCEAIDWVENDYLATPVEPTNVVTERDPTTIQFAAGVNAPTPIFTDTDFDKIVSPLTYFVPRTQGAWVQIQTPFPQLLRVDSLFGAIANTRVIDIDLEWIEHAEQSGLIQLVPFNQEIAFDFVGLLWVNAIRGATELPNFWHYNAIVGLRDTPCEVQELIAKKAAINALIVAGMALRPGVGSVSLSRDGVSESVSYTQTAEYGIYTGTIKAYKDWIKERGPELRSKYRGPTMVVV
jgi:hypothetical protein